MNGSYFSQPCGLDEDKESIMSECFVPLIPIYHNLCL